MRKIFAILILILFLTLGCVRKGVHPVEPDVEEEPSIEEEIECDALTPCSEGYECVRLPDKSKPVCVSLDVLKSDKYKDCAVAESYPVQLICPRINARGGCESDSDCKVSGCNGELCSEQEMMSICLRKPEHVCYKFTKCKCLNGKCGWGQTEEFLKCLNGKCGWEQTEEFLNCITEKS